MHMHVFSVMEWTWDNRGFFVDICNCESTSRCLSYSVCSGNSSLKVNETPDLITSVERSGNCSAYGVLPQTLLMH